MTKPRIRYSAVIGRWTVTMGPRTIDMYTGFRTLPVAVKFALWCVRQRTRGWE